MDIEYVMQKNYFPLEYYFISKIFSKQTNKIPIRDTFMKFRMLYMLSQIKKFNPSYLVSTNKFHTFFFQHMLLSCKHKQIQLTFLSNIKYKYIIFFFITILIDKNLTDFYKNINSKHF